MLYPDHRHENAEVSAGLNLKHMHVTSVCGRYGPNQGVIMSGVRARYVKLEHVFKKESMNICEIKVFGILGILFLLNIFFKKILQKVILKFIEIKIQLTDT
jgi:hypothetical protein